MKTSLKSSWLWIRHTFMRGLVFTVPIILTVWLLNLVFMGLDRIISPILVHYGVDLPGLGVLTMVLLILLIGVMSRNLVGHFLLHRIDSLMSRLPLARSIYTSVKGIIAAFPGGQQGKSFKTDELVEYPRKGIYSIGVVTNDLRITDRRGTGMDVVTVYFPHPPNPTSGVMIIVPKNDVRVLELSVEEGLKLALSGGIISPSSLEAVRQRRSSS
jgi:uncharacterized membrane protein